MAPRIVVAGSSNTDMILQVNQIPRRGETVLGGEFAMAAGGKGANQAVAASRAGGSVTFLARVGDDMFGRQAVESLEQDGICIDQVIRDSQMPSGVALIFVAADGENSIGVASGANARLSPDDVCAASDCIRSADVLVVQLETPLGTVERAVETAASDGVPVILNPAPAQRLSDRLLSLVTVLTPNETEAEALTGITVGDASSAAAAAAALRGRGVRAAILTLGARGAVVDSDRFCGIVPAFPVEPVDTTAAGDVFNGALAVSMAEGMPMRDAVRFATAAAALSVTQLGAQPSAPRRPEIETLLLAHKE